VPLELEPVVPVPLPVLVPVLVPLPIPVPVPVPKPVPVLVPVPIPVLLPLVDEPLRDERRLLLDCGREPVSLAPVPVVPIDPVLPGVVAVPVPVRSFVFP
jgi:hypothetical protein